MLKPCRASACGYSAHRMWYTALKHAEQRTTFFSAAMPQNLHSASVGAGAGAS